MTNMHSDYLSTVPIKPLKNNVAIIPVQTWNNIGGILSRAYQFKSNKSRNIFVELLLQREDEIKHPCRYIITDKQVIVKLTTKTIQKPTEIDFEFSKWIDSMFKDVIYNSLDEQ